MKQILRMTPLAVILCTWTLTGCNSNQPPKTSDADRGVTTTASPKAEIDGPSRTALELPKTHGVQTPFVIRPVDWDAATQGLEVVAVSPADLNRERLEERYPKQIVQVSGTVVEIGNDQLGREFTRLKLQGTIGEAVPFRVFETQSFARVGPGQKVTLQGIRFDVCPVEHFPFRILDAGANPCPIIPSSFISEEFANDTQKAHEKYYDQWFYAQGKVAEVRKEWDENILVTLEGNPIWSIVARVNKADAEASSLEAGKGFFMLAKYEPTELLPTSSKQVELKGSPITVAFPVAGMNYGSTMLSRSERDRISTEEMQRTNPTAKVDAPSLIRQFRDSENQFRSDYSGKVAEVEGVVQGFDVQLDGHAVVLLAGDELLTFDIAMTKDSPWESLQPGQRITTRGRFPRVSSTPRMEQGIVVDANSPENPIRSATSAEVITGCLASNEIFVSDWKDQFIKVTGKIQSVELDGLDPMVQLEGPDGALIRLELGSIQHVRQNRFGNESVGSTMAFLGRVNAVEDDSKTVFLKDCWILMGSGVAP